MTTNTELKTGAVAPLTRAPFIIQTRSGPREPAERTQWPRIGGLKDADIVQNPEVGTVDFLARYVPLDDVFVYACGSPGTQQLGRALRLPLYKLGLSQTPALLVRQRQISADEYGSYRRRGSAWIADSGFDRYEMQTTELTFKPHVHSPVSVVPRGLRVRLPRDLSFHCFHEKFNKALAPVGLNHFLQSAAGRRHLALLGQEPEGALRYTKYQWGGASNVEYRLANEISICRPRQDISYVAILVERLILDHVLARPASAGLEEKVAP